MSKLTFNLRETSKKSGIIQLIFNYGTKKRLRYSTGYKIVDVKNWNDRSMRIKNVVSEVNRKAINTKLDKVQLELSKQYDELVIRGDEQITKEMLKNICDILFNKVKLKPEEKPKELLVFFEWYLDYYKTNPLPTTHKPIGKGTLKTYKNTFNILKRFDSEIYKLTYSKITLDFHTDFINWLYEQDYSMNYVGTIIKILKTIMNSSFEKGLHKNIDFMKKSFSKPSEESINIYLNQEELTKMFELDVSQEHTRITNTGVKIDSEKLNRARDLFLISANTSLRISDFNRLSEKNIVTRKGKAYIDIKSKKTEKQLSIPVNAMTKSIFDKRGGMPPETMADQHINYALKILGELAGINDDVEKEITKGGIKQININKKYELITSHTGRRSFCSNAYLEGMPVIDIMAITGHSTEKVFYGYIKVSHIGKAEKISEHPFFK